VSKTFAIVNGDLNMLSTGQPQMLEAYNKLQQDINQALGTPYDVDRDYGNSLVTEGVLLAARVAIPALVQREVGQVMSRLRRFQSYIPRQYLPSTEKIDRVKSIIVSRQQNLGVAYLVTVAVVSKQTPDIRSVFRVRNEHLKER